jgi:hypothetical protein
MKARSALTRRPAAAGIPASGPDASQGRGDEPPDVVGAPTITLYVSDGRPDESETAFRSLETIGLAFEVAPAGDQPVRAEWGGRVFTGAAGVERLAARLRAFRDDLARLDGLVGDPRLKERASTRYQQQVRQAREQFQAIVRPSLQ